MMQLPKPPLFPVLKRVDAIARAAPRMTGSDRARCLSTNIDEVRVINDRREHLARVVDARAR